MKIILNYYHFLINKCQNAGIAEKNLFLKIPVFVLLTVKIFIQKDCSFRNLTTDYELLKG